MLFIKRLLTAVVLFGMLFMITYVGTMAVGGGMAGAKATNGLDTNNTRFNQGYQVGVQAGLKFRQEYGQTIGLIALAVSSLGALWLSFGGVLSWCQEPPAPPLPSSRFR